MTLPLLLRCVRCGCDETVRMWTADPHQSDFALCGCEGNKPWNDDEVQSLIEQALEKIDAENGPSDVEIVTSWGPRADESPSYRAAMIDAGRGHLLR